MMKGNQSKDQVAFALTQLAEANKAIAKAVDKVETAVREINDNNILHMERTAKEHEALVLGLNKVSITTDNRLKEFSEKY